MPRQWRVYKVMLICNIVLVLLLIMIYLFFMFRTGYRIIATPMEIFFTLVIPTVYCANLLYSSRLLAASFPKYDPPTFSKPLSVVLLILFMIMLLSLVLLFCYGFNEEFLKEPDFHSTERSGRYALVYIFILIALGVYNSIMQIKLILRFSASKREIMDNIINEIGQDNPS